MPAKTTKAKPKSNVAKTSSAGVLATKSKFNWKIPAILALVLAIALGYLYVRLSNASGTTLANYATTSMGQNGATTQYKSDGTRTFAGPGAPILRLQSSWAGYPQAGKATQFEVTYFSTTGGSGNGAVVAQACGKTLASSGNVGVVNGTRVSVKVTSEMISANCGGAVELQLITFLPANMYMTGMQVYDVTGTCGGYANIGIGATGSCVTLIQQKLVSLRYNPGPVDGNYGSQTSTAVRTFQQKAGLPQDGIVGPQTWGVLFSPNAPYKY